jgi:transposase
MDRREELRKRFAGQPPQLLEYALKLEAEAQLAVSQLAEAQGELEQAQRARLEVQGELEQTQRAQLEVRAQLAEAQGEKFRLAEEQAQLEAQLAEVQAQLAEAKAYIAELRRQLFGSKAEPLSAEEERQLKQLANDLQEQVQRPAADSTQMLEEEEHPWQRRSRPSRHPLPETLETETITLEPKTTVCSHCGQAQHRIGEEVTEEIDWIPAKLIRRRIVRPKYACRCEESNVAIAPLPPRLIPQSKLGLGLAVYILLTRFDDHLPFYHLEQTFRERYDMEIPRQQIVQWVERMADWLRPIYEAMWQAMKAGNYLQIDETPVKVLDREISGKTARGYLWFYAVPQEDVILEFSRSRGQEVPREKLAGFQGTMQTDAYEVYESLTKKDLGLQRIGCLAHARRRFYQALKESVGEAVWFIGQIRELYRIEDQARTWGRTERHVLRQAQAPPIWEALKTRAEELQPKLLPQSTLGKAVSYFLKEYEALIGYLRDGRFEIDNNLVENAIRPTAVGRRRWLFIGHPQAGWRSAVIYSILLSCRRRGINPQDYLTDVLSRLPSMRITEIHQLLPGHWKHFSPNTS